MFGVTVVRNKKYCALADYVLKSGRVRLDCIHDDYFSYGFLVDGCYVFVF